MTGFPTCESKPRDHIPEVHAEESDTHISLDWLDDANKLKQNKTATPVNIKTMPKKVGKAS